MLHEGNDTKAQDKDTTRQRQTGSRQRLYYKAKTDRWKTGTIIRQRQTGAIQRHYIKAMTDTRKTKTLQ